MDLTLQDKRCIVTGAMADAIIEYSPTTLIIDTETTVSISVTDSTGDGFGLGGVILEFSGDSQLSWDLDGPDAEGFTDDDGFRWMTGAARLNLIADGR